MMVSVTTRQPSPHSAVSAAAGPRLLIRQVQYLLISQLTFISEGNSPLHRLGTWLVACSSAPTVIEKLAVSLHSPNELGELVQWL